MHYRLFSSIPGLPPTTCLFITVLVLARKKKMSRDVVKCPLGGSLHPYWETNLLYKYLIPKNVYHRGNYQVCLFVCLFCLFFLIHKEQSRFGKKGILIAIITSCKHNQFSIHICQIRNTVTELVGYLSENNRFSDLENRNLKIKR